MKNLILFAFLTLTIMGLMSPFIVFDSFADKGGNDKAKGNPQGCDNDKGKDNQQNPNCNNTSLDSDQDGIPDNLDACPFQPVEWWTADLEPDHDGDGIADSIDDSPCP